VLGDQSKLPPEIQSQNRVTDDTHPAKTNQFHQPRVTDDTR